MDYREIKTPAEGNIFVLLRMATVVNGLPRALYLIQDTMYQTDRTIEGIAFSYESHNCPTNFIRDIAAFVDDKGFGRFNIDPHGLFTVVGWCTEEEGINEFGLSGSFAGPIKATGRQDDAGEHFVKAMIERFRIPPDDWMMEIGVDPHTASGDLMGAFLRRLGTQIENKLGELTQPEFENFRKYQGVLANRKIELKETYLDHAAMIIELATELKIDYKFGG